MASSLPDKDLSSVPAAQSTPKKTKATPNFHCPYCHKSYQKKFYFDRHVNTHTTQGPGPVTSSDITQGTLNLSDISMNTTFNKPAIPKTAKKKVVAGNQKKKTFVCTYCLKAYASDTIMRKHMRTHAMQEAASRFPDAEDIKSNAADIGSKALTEVSNCLSFGPSGQVFRELVGHVVSLHNFSDFSCLVVEEIISAVDKKTSLLPSALIKFLFGKLETALSDDDFCANCFSALGICHFDENVQSQFLIEFCLCLTSQIFHFISSSFRGHNTRAVRPMPELDMEDRQVIYYVAGSIMRGYLRLSIRYKNCLKWKEICLVLRSHVLCSEPVGEIDADWTRKLDRGGLLYINVDCQKFFISLTQLVYQNEKMDGSIDYDLIIKLVTESHTSVLWDNVFKDSLPEDVSVGLMNDVVSAFCKACGRGIARRRLNALRDKPVISMPTRHAVASRRK